MPKDPEEERIRKAKVDYIVSEIKKFEKEGPSLQDKKGYLEYLMSQDV